MIFAFLSHLQNMSMYYLSSRSFLAMYLYGILVLLCYGTSGKSFKSFFTSKASPSSDVPAASTKLDLSPLLQLFTGSKSIFIRDSSNVSVEISVNNDTVTALSQESLSVTPPSLLANNSIRRYFAIFGFYKINNKTYIAMVKSASELTFLRPPGSAIMKVDQIELIRIPTLHDTSEDVDDIIAVQSLTKKLNAYSFLYSLGSYDVLRPYQANQAGDVRRDPTDRFHWNSNLIKPLANISSSFLTSFINGYMKKMEFNVGKDVFTLVVIARRSRKQQGPRYIKRGADSEGEVANYVEIEQLVFKKGRSRITSFVQVRGSVPLFWNQLDPWKSKPKISYFNDNDNSPQELSIADKKQSLAVQLHFNHLYSAYNLSLPVSQRPALYLLNLIDKKEDQYTLGRLWFECLASLHRGGRVTESDLSNRNAITLQDFLIPLPSTMNNLKTRYIWLDYHYKTRHDGVKASLIKLRAYLESLLVSNSLCYDSDNQACKQQCLVRTNCVDCLDRTNVVQTAVSRWVLGRQVQCLDPALKPLFNRDGGLELPTEQMEKDFRKLWAELGDDLSLLYAGSRAMKRDVTINGKRTQQGVVEDALSYMKRYYVNNVRDRENLRDLNFMLGKEDSEDSELDIEHHIEELKKAVLQSGRELREGERWTEESEEDQEEDDDENEEEEETNTVENYKILNDVHQENLGDIADTKMDSNSESETSNSKRTTTIESDDEDKRTMEANTGENRSSSKFKKVVDEFFTELLDDLQQNVVGILDEGFL